MTSLMNTVPLKSSLTTYPYRLQRYDLRFSSWLTPRVSAQTHCRNVTSAASNQEALFHYTSGRWLWDDERQKDRLYKRFDVAKLQESAAKAVGAGKCVSIQKLSELVTREFRLTMDDGQSVIARVRYGEDSSVPGIVASEAAVMDFAGNFLGVPTPKVLAYSDDNDGPVGCKYLIHTEPRGKPLGEAMDSMTLAERLDVVGELVSIQKRLTSVLFSRYGSLYFANDAPPASRPAEIEGDVTTGQQHEVRERYMIGPAALLAFWSNGRALARVDRGPWSSALEYLQASCDREIDYLAKYAVVRNRQTKPFTTKLAKDQHNRARHIALLEKMKAVCQHILPRDSRLSKASLWHDELWTDMIYVDGSKITDITEWSGVWAGPLFLQASKPGNVIHHKLSLSESQELYHNLSRPERQQMVENSTRQSLADSTYYVKTQSINPVLQRIYETQHWQHRKALTDLAQNSWDADIMLFQEHLLKIIRRWNDIDPDISCPISFTDDEIQSHIEESKDFNEEADLWDSLYPLIHRNGFVDNENYDWARELFAMFRDQYLADLSNTDLEDFERATRWAKGPGSE